MAIIQFAGSLRARGYASRIIKHLITLYTRERDYRKKQITTLRSWATSRLLQGNYNQIQYARCKRIVASIVEHEQGIIDYLMYRADTTDMDRSKWVWTPRDEIPLPKAPHTMLKDEGSDSLALSVPQVTSIITSDYLNLTIVRILFVLSHKKFLMVCLRLPMQISTLIQFRSCICCGWRHLRQESYPKMVSASKILSFDKFGSQRHITSKQRFSRQ